MDFMAFTVFNPRSRSRTSGANGSRKGNMVFSELPPEAQNALLAELAKRVRFHWVTTM